MHIENSSETDYFGKDNIEFDAIYLERHGNNTNNLSLNTSAKVYSDHINPSSTVVMFGISNDITIDPSTLFLSQLLASGNGKLLIADPIWDNNDVSLSERLTNGWIEPIGNVKSYLSQIDELSEKGLSLIKPVWLGPKTGIFRVKEISGCADVVIDHGTSIFVLSAHLKKILPKPIFVNSVRNIFRNFYATLKDHGEYIMQVNQKRYFKTCGYQQGTINGINIEDELNRAGFKKVTHEKVDDKFKIIIPNDIIDSFSDSEWSYLVKQENGESYLEIVPCLHNSPDLYRAQK
jgi:hypothetical protein